MAALFQYPITSLAQNCYETIAQPVCHRQVVVGFVYDDHIEFWCPVHAPAGTIFTTPPPPEEPEPQVSPVRFPEP